MNLEELKKKIPAIKRQLDGGEKQIVIVDGPKTPTGKTTATKMLAAAGVTVYEEYQVLRITLDACLPEKPANAEKR